MGSAPASGAVGRALATHELRLDSPPPLFGTFRLARVRRAGAPNSSRGGCAPLHFNCREAATQD